MIVSHFNSKQWKTVSVDFSASENASTSIVIPSGHWGEQLESVKDQIAKSKQTFDIIYCAAGGWSGGGIKSDKLVESVERMIDFNLKSALACSAVAALYLNQGGLLVLTGAQAALAGTSGMIAYGVTKDCIFGFRRSSK